MLALRARDIVLTSHCILIYLLRQINVKPGCLGKFIPLAY